MAGEAIKTYGSTTTVITASSTLADGAIDTETKTSVSTTYPLMDVVLTGAFSIAPSAGATVHVYRRDLDIDGTADAPVPDANYKSIYIGSMIVDAVTASQSVMLPGAPTSPDFELYLENDAGETLGSGWTLKATPWTYTEAA